MRPRFTLDAAVLLILLLPTKVIFPSFEIVLISQKLYITLVSQLLFSSQGASLEDLSQDPQNRTISTLLVIPLAISLRSRARSR